MASLKSYYKIYRTGDTITMSPILVAPDNMQEGTRCKIRPWQKYREYLRCFRTRGDAEQAYRIDQLCAKIRSMSREESLELMQVTRKHLRKYFESYSAMLRIVGLPRTTFRNALSGKKNGKPRRIAAKNLARLIIFRETFDRIFPEIERKFRYLDGTVFN